MTSAEYKVVSVSDTVSIPVPIGLAPEKEADFIASRLAFVNLQRLEADCEEAMRLSQEGKLLPLREVLQELQDEADRAKRN